MQQLTGVHGEDGVHAVVRVVEEYDIDIDRVMDLVLVTAHLLNLNHVTLTSANVSLAIILFRVSN